MKNDSTAYSSRSADKFVIRLPEGMREKIAEIAKRYHRSMNSEIINRLEKSLTIDTHSPSSNELTAKMEAFSAMRSASRGEEDHMLGLFRKLPRQQQLAVLAFLESMES